MRTRLSILLLLFVTAFAAPAQSFTHLVFQDGHETEVADLRLSLAGPDKPDDPDLWEGPLTIAHSGTRCTVDASLIQSAYLSSTGKLLVVVSISGSNTFVHFYDPLTCASHVKTIKAFTHGVTIEGARLKLAPACACEEPGKPCNCTAGSVYRLSDNAPPVYLEADSRALTKQALGISFSGTRHIAHPAEGTGH